MTVFAHSQTTNKLVNEAANDSARVSGRDRKIPPALGTNQQAGFGGFRPLASLEQNECRILLIFNLAFNRTLFCFGGLVMYNLNDLKQRKKLQFRKHFIETYAF